MTRTRHVARLGRVRPLELGIGRQHEIGVDTETLDTAVPEIPDHVVVGVHRCDCDRRAHQHGKRQRAEKETARRLTQIPGNAQRCEIRDAGNCREREEQGRAEWCLGHRQRQHRGSADQTGEGERNAQ